MGLLQYLLKHFILFLLSFIKYTLCKWKPAGFYWTKTLELAEQKQCTSILCGLLLVLERKISFLFIIQSISCSAYVHIFLILNESYEHMLIQFKKPDVV